MIAYEFFEINDSWKFFKYFCPDENPIFWIPKIHSAVLQELSEVPLKRISRSHGCHIDENVFIHESVILPEICVIKGPSYIGEGTIIRPFAYIRGNVIIGQNCIIGNSCEIKNSILLNNVQVPHFNYVGDSILGNYSHIGAGVICANLRLDKKNVVIHHNGKRIKTDMQKLGAIIGDHSEVACNVVLNPGTVLEKNSVVLNYQYSD